VVSAKVATTAPHNLLLYPRLSLDGHQGPLPFYWSGRIWSSLVDVSATLCVPVQMLEQVSGERRFLKLLVYDEITSDQLAHLTTSVSQAFCANLDLLSFYHDTAVDPMLALLVRNLIGLRPHLSMSLFEGLAKAIIRQLVRASYARETISLIVMHFGTRRVMNGRVFYGFPTPRTLAKARKSDLLRCKLGYKWKLMRQIARDVAAEDLNLQELTKRSSDEIIGTLEAYKGVGYWTSRIFLYDALKRLDAYPILDISLRRALSSLYFAGRPIPWTEVEGFFDSWHNYTGILVPYLFGYLWLKRHVSTISQAR
jgi:3-methyladenine DNA glycosylase/8-oxoguanine DNA glycosylase